MYSHDEIACPEHIRAVGVEVLTDAIAQVLRLADVDDFGFLVAKEIAAGLCWQVGELFFERHDLEPLSSRSLGARF